jgi:hypothetical protein
MTFRLETFRVVLLTFVSQIIPVSIKCNKAVWSIALIFSILNNINNCSNEHSYYSYDKWIIILVFLYKIARFNSPSLQSVCKSCRHLPAIIWLPGLRVCDKAEILCCKSTLQLRRLFLHQCLDMALVFLLIY